MRWRETGKLPLVSGQTVWAQSPVSYLSKDQLGCYRSVQARKTTGRVEGMLTSESPGAGKQFPSLLALTFDTSVSPSAKQR